MAIFPVQNPWLLAAGILGNLISFMVYLAPLPIFIRVCRKKTTEGFQSIPYLVALFSAMLWLFYAFYKSDVFLLITSNSVGCFIETVYIVIYLIYAPRHARVRTLKILFLLNTCASCLIFLLCHFLFKGTTRVKVVGWVCVAVSSCVYASPLSIMRRVIRTKSIQFMPFTLSFFLTLSAIAWFFYGMLMKDIFITLPNILGLIFGTLQMVLYVVYKYCKMGKVEDPEKLPVHIVKTSIEIQPSEEKNTSGENQKVDDHTAHNEKSAEGISNGIQPSRCQV